MEESLDHFDLLRSLWSSGGEGWKLTALPVQASRGQPARPAEPEELLPRAVGLSLVCRKGWG